jgi:hypothetical protein
MRCSLFMPYRAVVEYCEIMCRRVVAVLVLSGSWSCRLCQGCDASGTQVVQLYAFAFDITSCTVSTKTIENLK